MKILKCVRDPTRITDCFPLCGTDGLSFATHLKRSIYNAKRLVLLRMVTDEMKSDHLELLVYHCS